MKKLALQLILASILTIFGTGSSQAAPGQGLHEFFEKKDYKGKITSAIANIDVGISVSLGDIDLIDGVNLGLKARYEVEPSYLDQYYTRLDQYKVKGNINVGDIVENFIDLPFSFSVNRENSFYFVRQFPTKKSAIKALPYSPARLPVSAERALKFLEVGDFVSMPANLNVVVEARAKTSHIAPIIVSANAGIYWIVSGEFTIQVFKLDETRVRLKILSKRAYGRGANGGVGMSFDVFGVRVVDKQLERVVDKDFVELGYEVNPGEQFIVDYVFDLGNTDAKKAYDQILRSTVKFKDIAILNKLKGGNNLKDKLISSFEMAEELFESDKLKSPKERRVSRIFKGFNDYQEHSKKLKLGFLFTSLKRDKTCTDSKFTFIDKNENNLEYFYPTCSKYIETRMGKWIFDLKDEDFQNNFGLIPKINHDDAKNKDPDFGLNYERRDKVFSPGEQRIVHRFLLGQMPKEVGEKVNIGEWRQNTSKKDSKINFQLILKAQGFKYLRGYSEEELLDHLLAYYNERKTLAPVTKTEAMYFKLKKFFNIGKTSEKRVKELASDLYNIIKNEEQNSSEMLKKLVELTTDNLFDKIGVGFLISLLPQEKISDLIYVNLSVKAKNAEELKYEYGQSNYKTLYKELAKIQTRITSQTYDLRLSDEDHEMEDNVITDEETLTDPLVDAEIAQNEAI